LFGSLPIFLQQFLELLPPGFVGSGDRFHFGFDGILTYS
jgi:hypothetical protein